MWAELISESGALGKEEAKEGAGGEKGNQSAVVETGQIQVCAQKWRSPRRTGLWVEQAEQVWDISSGRCPPSPRWSVIRRHQAGGDSLGGQLGGGT